MNERRGVLLVIAVIVVGAALLIGFLAYSTLSHPSSSSGGSVTPGAGVTAACPAGGAGGGDWPTYHQTGNRTGVLSPATVASVHAAWLQPTTLDGQIYAEPLVCGHTIYVATENDSVYAINAVTGSVLWRTNLGTPMPGGNLPCGNINPSGITGTPVIDGATGTLYAVAFLSSGSHVLVGLNLTSGAVVSRIPIDPNGANPLVEQQRGALTLANGYVYVVFGGLYGDCGQYHGWVVGAPTSGSGGLIAYQVPTQREGAIWGTAGTALAPNGDLYVATGNGASNTQFDHGDAVIELAPNLTELGYFAPTNWAQLNEDDTDLGSVAPTLLPNGDLFQIGKAGVGYVLSGTDLGGIGGQLGENPVCAGAYGGTAHVGFSIFVPCLNGVFDVVVSGTNFTVAWHTPGFYSGSPVVTGNVVWAVNVSTATLMGFSIDSGQPLFSFPLSGADHFISPTAAPGELFVGGGKQVFAFDLS